MPEVVVNLCLIHLKSRLLFPHQSIHAVPRTCCILLQMPCRFACTYYMLTPLPPSQTPLRIGLPIIETSLISTHAANDDQVHAARHPRDSRFRRLPHLRMPLHKILLCNPHTAYCSHQSVVTAHCTERKNHHRRRWPHALVLSSPQCEDVQLYLQLRR